MRKYSNNRETLADADPELSKQWHPSKNGHLLPSDFCPHSHNRSWWVCDKGHEWEANIQSRHRNKRGCPYCSNQKVNIENCLATLNPELSKEWHPVKNGRITPYDVLSMSSKKVWWKCGVGHEYFSAISNRNSVDSGCPYCSGHLPTKETCLSFKNPELCKEWNYIKNKNVRPENVSEFSHKKVWWKCLNGHEWKTEISYRSDGSGCPYCNGVLLRDGELCDSIVEAYKYLEYKWLGLTFKHNKVYHVSFGKYRYDFYFPEEDKYVEVTSYNKKKFANRIGRYIFYLRKIVKKRQFVEEVLGAKFEFIQFTPTKEQVRIVNENKKPLRAQADHVKEQKGK